MSTTQSPRSDTRARILDVALELFAAQGYEKTSLREIADRLGVTKAALYYHFKTKDEIVRGIVRSMAAPIDEAIAFGEGKPWSPELRDELVRRFAAGMAERRRCCGSSTRTSPPSGSRRPGWSSRIGWSR